MEYIGIADIEQLTGLPRHVVNHAISRYGPKPCGRVGITRVWHRSDIHAIRQSIARTHGADRASAELAVAGSQPIGARPPPA